LKIKAELDTHSYPTGVKVSDVEYESINLRGKTFHA